MSSLELSFEKKRVLADAGARERIATDLASTLVVEAAAGTGKTTALVGRVLGLVRTGKGTLARTVAVTFTEKAAGEMKLRLRTEIERARHAMDTTPVERARFDEALRELEAAHIGTIHGFCADLLRERPVEARVDPLFEVAAEDEKDRLFEDAFEPWFQAELASPGSGVGRVLRRRTRDRDAPGPRGVLRSAAAALVEQRDFDAKWERRPFSREPSIDAVLDDLFELAKLAPLADYEDGWLYKSLAEIARFTEELARRERVRGGRDYDGLEAELRALGKQKLWGWKGSGKWYARSAGVERQTVLDRRAAVKETLERVLEAADADLAACLRHELDPVVAAYERLKRRAGKLDFLDLLVLTRDLVRDDRAVRNELQQRYEHLLVDEFQDTDPLQAEILLLLAADDPAERDAWSARPIPGKLFVVGDPKQSIYRFRRADVTLYDKIKRHLVACGAHVLHLVTSFRSAPSIQRAVNAAFAPRMQGSGDGSQAEYVPLEPWRDDPDGRPTVIALPVPRPYGDYGKIVNFKIDDSFPDAVGAFVDWLVNRSGWTITERDRAARVPIEARHVCLLFKRLQNFGSDVTRPYVRALEARRIPHVLVGGRSYHAREEVLAIRNALSAIEWPDDELSVFATLRGPFFALGDDALLAWRHAQGGMHPFKAIDQEKLSDLTRPVHEALSILARLHRGRNRRPIADTIVELLETTRAHAGIAIWPTGEQALANILRVLDLARRFEAQGATSFRSFVTRLQDDAARGGAAEAPVVEEGTDGVRIMTVHRAKGLEFPVVILVDPTAPPTAREPSRYVDPARKLWAMPLAQCTPIELIEHRDEVLRHDQEEAVRLAYVAATRAREILVVPVCGDEEIAGWTGVLADVVHPPEDRRRSPSAAAGCPAFGKDSVRDRPDNAPRVREDSVAPGAHAPRAGEHTVVWWDPYALDLDREHDVGLRQQRILEADKAHGADAQGERQHELWQRAREEAVALGARPTQRVKTVTERKASLAKGSTEAEKVPVETTPAAREGRPRGKRFGVLVHAVLAAVDLAADADAIARVTRAQGRLVGATAAEIEAAGAAASAALAHPVMARARAASEVRREVSVLLRQADGVLLEGVVDLAFLEAGAGWTIVDFKTDAELSTRLAEYELQVRLYADAITAATSERARGLLLSV